MAHHLRVALAASLALATTPVAAEPVEEEAECPEFIRGAKLRLANTAQGASLTITTPRRQHVQELRFALREAAGFLERRAGKGHETDEPTAQIPPIAIAVRPVDAGLLLTVRARNATDVELLRRQIRVLEVLWQRSTCINGEGRIPSSVSA